MDEILDHFFSSSSWTDVDVKERSSLDCSENPQLTNEMLLGSLGVIEDDDNIPPTYLSNSNHSNESLAAQSASSVVAHDLESDSQENVNNCAANFSNYQMGLQYDMDGNMVRSASVSSMEPQNVGGSFCDQSVLQRFNGDFKNPTPLSQAWPLQAYDGVSSSLCPPVMGQQKLCGFGNSDMYDLSDLLSTEEMGNYALPSFALGPQIPVAMTGLQSLPQTMSTAECAGTKKPRIRARRGQATDPHSIAERLRREKIADRMKNVQELVPKSNKTDKASLLDEIIEYVKFLQQQIKALSARKVGAKREIVPFILDNQAKGANGLSQPPLLGQVANDSSFNEIAFEQVLNLMETDVTNAMHYLQSKGLCMMPVALANAIIAEKESSPAPDSFENLKNTSFTDEAGFVNNPSSSSSSNSSSLLPASKP